MKHFQRSRATRTQGAGARPCYSKGRRRRNLLPFVALFFFSSFPARASVPFEAGRFLLEYFLEKGLDALWDEVTGKPDIRMLDIQLNNLEHTVREIDQDLTEELQDLRQRIDERVTKREVEEVVRRVLRRLHSRVDELDNRIETVEERINKLEELFGVQLTLAPSPTLITTLESGELEGEPLVARWASLLSDSLAIRRELEDRLRIYTDSSSEVLAARERNAEVVSAISSFRRDVLHEMSTRLREREKMLRSLRRQHPQLRQYDQHLATLAWLVAVSKVRAEGVLAGHLEIPRRLLESEGSEILRAVWLAGGEIKGTSPLAREIILLERRREDRNTATNWLVFSDSIKTLYAKTVRLEKEYDQLVRLGTSVARSLETLLKDYTRGHPKVKASLREKAELLEGVRRVNSSSEALLTVALEIYIEHLTRERRSNPRMSEFRQGVIYPLLDMEEATRCLDWEIDVEVEVTWRKFLAADSMAPATDLVPLSWMKGETASSIEGETASMIIEIEDRYGIEGPECSISTDNWGRHSAIRVAPYGSQTRTLRGAAGQLKLSISCNRGMLHYFKSRQFVVEAGREYYLKITVGWILRFRSFRVVR